MLDLQQGPNGPELHNQKELMEIPWENPSLCSQHRWPSVEMDPRASDGWICSMPISREGDGDGDRHREENKAGTEKVSWCKRER